MEHLLCDFHVDHRVHGAHNIAGVGWRSPRSYIPAEDDVIPSSSPTSEMVITVSLTEEDHKQIARCVVAEMVGTSPARRELRALSPERVAEVLDTTRDNVYDLLNRGELEWFAMGRQKRIPVDVLEAYMARRVDHGQA